jgi:hypothetical protein
VPHSWVGRRALGFLFLLSCCSHQFRTWQRFSVILNPRLLRVKDLNSRYTQTPHHLLVRTKYLYYIY